MGSGSVRNLVTRLIRFLTPWYSEVAAEERERRTEAVRQRSIRARLGGEQVIENYRAADERLGRMSGR